MWVKNTYKVGKTAFDLRVSLAVNDIINIDWITSAEQFETYFKEKIAAIPRSNQYKAEYLYKITQRNLTSLEVWKLDLNGDFKYKMFQLDYKPEVKD